MFCLLIGIALLTTSNKPIVPTSAPTFTYAENYKWEMYCYVCYYYWITPCQQAPDNLCPWCNNWDLFSAEYDDCILLVEIIPY